VSGGEQNGKAPEIPATLVAKTVAWQVHWDRKAGMTGKAPETLTFKMDEKSEVWINGLQWIISFDDRNGEPFPYLVQRVPELPEEMKRDAPLPFARRAEASVKLPAYSNSFRKLSTFKADIRETLLDAFNHEAGSTNMLAFYKDQTGQPVKKVRFWIAPVDLNFPVILYAVEGVPYVGKVYFGLRSFKPLYSEFNYITDPGSETHNQGLKLISAIKAEGDQFKLQNGHLALAGR